MIEFKQEQANDEDNDLSQWAEPAEIAQINPHFTEGKVKHDLRQRKHNGLEEAGAVLKVGKKHLVHKIRYPRWLAQRARGAV